MPGVSRPFDGNEPSNDLGQAGRIFVANYIADMTAQLARLARSAEFGVLAYLLDMAAAEARGLGEDAAAAEPRAASSRG